MKNGFQLIELLVVLSIISILSLCALPLYSQHIMKEKRLAAATSLQQIAVALEQYHLENNTFIDATLAKLNFHNTNQVYQFNIESADEDAYLIAAIPVGKQADDACGTLMLAADGKKSMTGKSDINDCW